MDSVRPPIIRKIDEPRHGFRFVRVSLVALVTCFVPSVAGAEGPGNGWIDLTGPADFHAWQPPTGTWYHAADARVDPTNVERLGGKTGHGVIINGADGRTRNLYTRQSFGDVELHLEFLVPKGSNSGIKLQGLYEIQIIDGHDESPGHLTGSDCGGIYPRAELLPRYHHIDDGIAPEVDAAKPAGDWQTLDLIFRAPRFDGQSRKIASARFDKVVLNGQVIHHDREVPAATGHNWRLPEVPRGPLMLQADHGPVAFRNVRVRPLE